MCGVIYRSADTVTNGMPLGTIDTGCIDLESNGTFGFSTIFNTHTPQRGGSAVRMPVLALAVGGKTWALCREGTTQSMWLPHVAEWLPADLGVGQPAWAVSATGVPGWAKSVGISVCDIPKGRVFCHNPTVLRWTSPVRGQLEIRGGLWVCRNHRSRAEVGTAPKRTAPDRRPDRLGPDLRFSAAVCVRQRRPGRVAGGGGTGRSD